MRRVVARGMCAVLGGCGMSSPIKKSSAVAFNDRVEDTTNNPLMT